MLHKQFPYDYDMSLNEIVVFIHPYFQLDKCDNFFGRFNIYFCSIMIIVNHFGNSRCFVLLSAPFSQSTSGCNRTTAVGVLLDTFGIIRVVPLRYTVSLVVMVICHKRPNIGSTPTLPS